MDIDHSNMDCSGNDALRSGSVAASLGDSPVMSSPLSERLHQILDRFDKAWNCSPPPRIEDFLAEADRAEAEPAQRLSMLIELVRIDMERRLKAGERVRLEETYSQQRFPELYAVPSAIAALAIQEFELRRRAEPDLSPEEYLVRLPQFRDEVLAQLPTQSERTNNPLKNKDLRKTASKTINPDATR
ncbi:MAG: hypothetical protein ACYC3I_07730 [Gemmataceae bacterium]